MPRTIDWSTPPPPLVGSPPDFGPAYFFVRFSFAGFGGRFFFFFTGAEQSTGPGVSQAALPALGEARYRPAMMRWLIVATLAASCTREDEPAVETEAEPRPVERVEPRPTEPARPAFDDRPRDAVAHDRRVRVVFRGTPMEGARPGQAGIFPRWACPVGSEILVVDASGNVWSANGETGERTQREDVRDVRSPDCADDGVYFEQGGEVRRVGPSGIASLGAVEDDPMNTVITAQAIYFGLFDRTELFAMPRAGGAVTRLANGTSDPGPMDVDATHLYWTEYRSGNVSRAPIEGGPVQVLARRQPHPIGIAVDDEHVYFGNETDGSILRIGKSGGAPTELVTGQTNHDEIAHRDGFIYWRSWGNGPEGHTFARVPVTGGPIQLLVSRLSMPEHFVFTRDRAYLVNKGDGEVLEISL
jgi:hypothetical protein